MKFNKTIIRIVSMVLCISMLSTASMQTFAAANVGAGQEQEVYLEIGDTRIDYYETEEGDQVFLEYIDGVLTQRNTIPVGQEDIVVREFLNTEENRIAGSGNTDVIHPSDYIISEESEEVELPSPRKAMGTIRYRSSDNTGFVYYGMKCSCKRTSVNSTYTIRSFAGKLIDIVSLLTSATGLLANMGKTYIKRLCISAGVTISGGVLKGVLSTTVACKKYTCKWKLVDVADSGHKTTYTGYKYHVTDSSYNTGENYYEGLCPRDWGKQELAVIFHDKMFGYTSYDVIGWS